ncbi:hypothetical protein [Comamonas testosteroni]|uniref:hypothetical protein n=1 Tax=Comamonas testosteroni TaxID=285 RepID=UPI0026ECFF60|nr:hypothetical protein [Comamonas testosteroni]WQD42234.1 hypothetical protein U0024_21275 [Comamonas testosteroni]
MNFEFEDSEIAAVSLHNGALQIRFSAARVHDGDRAGAGEGLWQPLLLICERVAPTDKALGADLTPILAAVGRVRQAQLQIAGQRLRRLPLPFASDAGFVLELEMGDGLFCRLKGQGLALQALPSRSSVDSYQC